jgi:hypothetical protein
VSLNSDGSLRPDAVRRALEHPVSRDIDNSDSDDQYASNVAQDYAVLSAAWAEHMPDTIPPNILASNDITGDHWSSRWWANQAAELLAQMGHSDFTDAPGDGVIYGRLNHAWTPTLSLTGGQLTGGLTLTNGNLTLNAGGFVGYGRNSVPCWGRPRRSWTSIPRAPARTTIPASSPAAAPRPPARAR